MSPRDAQRDSPNVMPNVTPPPIALRGSGRALAGTQGKNIVGASETLGRRRCKRGIRSAAMRGGNLISRKHEGSTGRTPRKRFVSVWRRNSANPVQGPGKGSGRLSMFAGRLGGRRGRTRRREETSAPSALRAVDAKSLRFIVRPPKDFGSAPAPGFICPASHRAIVAGAERPGGQPRARRRVRFSLRARGWPAPAGRDPRDRGTRAWSGLRPAFLRRGPLRRRARS